MSTTPTANKQRTKRGNTNAVRHGLRSTQNVLLPGEKKVAFVKLLAGYHAQFMPEGVAEVETVNRIVALRWKLRRADLGETDKLKEVVANSRKATKEQKALDLVSNAATALSGLIANLPAMRRAAAVQESGQVLLRVLPKVIAFVDEVAVRIGLPMGTLADLVAVAERVKIEAVIADQHLDGVPDQGKPEFHATLDALLQVAQRARQALMDLQTQAQRDVEAKTASLVNSVSLTISDTRRLDRYRVATERSIGRELDHLRQLKMLRGEKSSFGTEEPRPEPVELRIVGKR